MSSFAKATFDVAGYLTCRPSYPARIWDIICKYHGMKGGRFERALDVGCGPGFVAMALAPHFRHVQAIDPAKKMVDIGLQHADPAIPRIRYGVGSAEDLNGVAPVDLVVAGQAAHWFNYPKVWREFSRCVRPGGTVAFIGYAEMVFPRHPHLNHYIAHHSRQALGSYWQPGRRIVEAYLEPVPFPVPPSVDPSLVQQLPPLSTDCSHPVSSRIEESRLESEDDLTCWNATTAIRLRSDILQGEERPWLMRKTFTWAQLEGYLRTWSALHSYQEKHPERRGEDIVDRLMAKLKGELNEQEVEVGWPLVLMMIKKT